MMRLSRFERKVLWVIVAVTCAPLLAALVLGQVALKENYQLGLNQRVLGRLHRYVDVYKEYLETLREYAEHRAQGVAEHWQVRAAVERKDAKAMKAALRHVVAGDPYVLAAAIQDANGQRVASVHGDAISLSTPSTGEPLPTTSLLSKTVTRSVLDGWQVEVTIRVPQRLFDEYVEVGQFVRDFEVLVRGTNYLSNRYLAVYAFLVLVVIMAAFGLGIWGARQVTHRVALLAEATQQVGAGNLSVQVRLMGNDEITTLTQAFNTMVRDMRESRGRIAYLQRISAWQEVARRLAHEIKNPLTPILLAVQELESGGRSSDPNFAAKLTQAREIVEEEVATLRRLVEEFSAFAKLPAVHPQPIDLRDFVRQSTRALSTDTKVSLELGDRPIPVRLDSMLMKGCLDNLILNARQAIASQASKAAGAGRIVIETSAQANHATLSVDDNGPGVSPEYQEQVFDPYHTTKPSGTGLGLAIVKKVVLEHGGSITCTESTLGGASFVIQLPLQRA
jgi:two-component system nitrogen regulation sensor histidine kinase NtrY